MANFLGLVGGKGIFLECAGMLSGVRKIPFGLVGVSWGNGGV